MKRKESLATGLFSFKDITELFSFKNINRAEFINQIAVNARKGYPDAINHLIEGYVWATGEKPDWKAGIAKMEELGGTNIEYGNKLDWRVDKHWEKYQTEQKAGYSSIKSKIEEKAQEIFTQLKWEGEWETAKVAAEEIIRQDGHINREKIGQAIWSVLGREDLGIKEKLNRAIPELFTQIKVDTLVNQVTEFVKGAITQYETSQVVIGGIASAQVGLQYDTQMKLYEGLFDILSSRENRELLPSIEVSTGPIDPLKEAGKKASIGTGVMVACDSAVTRLGWLVLLR